MRSWLELLVADPRRDGDADIVLIIGEHTVKVRELLEERRRIMLRRVEHRTVGCVPAPREQAGTFVVVDRVLSCGITDRSEEHTSELQSLMRTSYAVFCLKKKKLN